ncbi:phosphatidylcholine/phosphatidylserine synthase [Rhodobacteraceae bacterium XHP0102]|nr:phosphatidylcholine/phosphatidylserine synthase [Rhodobacteraceae bacterium XHP0102]
MKRLFSRNSEAEGVPFALLLPNLVTLTGMCLGLTSIRFAMDGRFKTAVVLILLAAVMDGLDGLIARRLNATSRLGAELDSLSDFLCFGVAPALLVYQLMLNSTGSFGWIAVLTFAGACCLRLARFNVMRADPEKQEATNDTPDLDDVIEEVENSKPHFIGVPAPGGAMLGLLPVYLVFAGFDLPMQHPFIGAVWLCLVAILMISTLKTFSPKALKIPRWSIAPLMIVTVVFVGLIFSTPWTLFAAICGGYGALIVSNIIRARGQLFG